MREGDHEDDDMRPICGVHVGGEDPEEGENMFIAGLRDVEPS